MQKVFPVEKKISCPVFDISSKQPDQSLAAAGRSDFQCFAGNRT